MLRRVAAASAGVPMPTVLHDEVRTQGRVVAWADTRLDAAPSGGVHIQVEIARGHQPMWVRRRLVETVLARASSVRATRVTLSVPLGDSEVLTALRDRCRAVQTHPAGATCLIDAEL